MKLLHKKSLFSALLSSIFILGTQSCAPKDEAHQSNDSLVFNKEQALKLSPFAKSYDLKGWEDCSTGSQVIDGESLEDVKTKYCVKLQNGYEHNSCAETQRLELFLKDCQGESWNPRENYIGLTRIKKGEERINGSFPVKETLAQLRVLSHKIEGDLSASELSLARQMVKKFSTCGMKSDCLVDLSPTSVIIYDYVRWQPENTKVLVVIGGIAYQSTLQGYKPNTQKQKPVYFVFKYKDQNVASPPVLEVWLQNYTQGFRSYKEFFGHAVSSKKLLTIQTRLAL